jgi:hypothetical protein
LKQLITYIGLDVHKETIAVALAEAGKRSEVREYGKIANTQTGVNALAAKGSVRARARRPVWLAGDGAGRLRDQRGGNRGWTVWPAAQPL